MRLIDADALDLDREVELADDWKTAHEIANCVKYAPTIDAVPVKHGRWIHCKGESSIWYCSVCGEKITYNPTRKTYKPDKKPVWEINKYCRCCGARMDLEEQDG